MIIEDNSILQSIYHYGTMDFHFFRKSMLIGFLESMITLIGSFLIMNPQSVPFIICSLFLMGCTFIIWYDVFFNPTMLTNIILHPKKTLKLAQNILQKNKIDITKIQRILIVPIHNHARLISGVYIQDEQGVTFYPNYVESTQKDHWDKTNQGVIFVSYAYAIKNGEIYFNHRNYYEDIRQHNLQKKLKKKI